MSTKPFVSIIVLNYNGKRYLENCFASLQLTNYPKSRYEVLLVDNGSTDDSTEVVEKMFPWVRIIKLNKNYGFGGGNNKGVRCAKGEYIAFLNNDTQVSQDWLLELVKASIDHSAFICASKTLFMDNHKLVDFAGGKFTINGRGYSTAFLKLDDGKKECFLTGYPCAASMLITKNVFLTLRGFDEDYFACLDDTDLGWRAWLTGYKTLCCPSSVVYHHFGGTAGESRISPLKAFHGTKGPVIAILKNLEFRRIFYALFLALFYDFIESLLLIKNSNLKCVLMKAKAYSWLIQNISIIFHKRRTVQRSRKFSDKWLLDMGFLASFNEGLREYSRLSKLAPQV